MGLVIRPGLCAGTGALGTTCDTDIVSLGGLSGWQLYRWIASNCDDGDPCTVDTCSQVSGCKTLRTNCCIPDWEGCGSDGCGGFCGICPEGGTPPEQVCSDCVPQCIGLTCGDDGCGGLCGTCPTDWECVEPGICMSCVPDCEGKSCGGDGCEGSCGSCGLNKECDFDTGQCVECIPDCGDKVCGDDGCGGSCGSCGEAAQCTDEGQCECVPQCEGVKPAEPWMWRDMWRVPDIPSCLPGGVCLVMGLEL